MWTESMTNISIDNFTTFIENKKVILLYPQTTYRNILMSYVLKLSDLSFLYYRTKSGEATIQAMLSGMLEELNDDFGSSLRKELKSNNIQKLARALADDLSNYGLNTILYLDELDRVEINDEFRQFFTELIANLSDQNKLVINSRQLTTEPWRQLVRDGVAVSIGTERRQSQLTFSPEQPGKPQLEVYGFGRGHAIVNGLPVESWDGALPRQLFFYFVDNDLITRDEIFKTFWADLKTKEATNVFHVTKRKISERLSINVLDGGNYELTVYSNGFYRPGKKIVRHYDVSEFESCIEEASMTFDDDKQAALYRRAIDLYRAPFLLTVDMPWVHERREKLQRLLLEALIGLARIHKSADRHEQALGYFMRAIHENPLREDIHREVMKIYTTLGYPDEAIRQYEQLETLLQDTIGVAPGPETQELLGQIQN